VIKIASQIIVAKAAVSAATDKRTWKIVGVIIGVIVTLVSLPLIVYMGVSGSMEDIKIDTASAQQSIVQNMSADEKDKLTHIEEVMASIQTEFAKRKLNNLSIKKAQAIRVTRLKPHTVSIG